MERYEKIHPGLANRLVVLVENQQSHRQAIESKFVTDQGKRMHAGQILAAVVALGLAGAAVACAAFGCEGAAIAIASTDVAGLVTAYGLSAHFQHKKTDQKRATELGQAQNPETPGD
jgi:uncharacterized membrane protein